MTTLAIAGAGHWGPHLIRNFHQGVQSRVAYVVEVDRSRRTEIQERYPDVEVVDDASVLTRAGIDAVVVATPTKTHFDLAMAALEAGKHVLVEKPLADNAKRAAELAHVADSRDLVLMVGHVFLFNPGIRKLADYVADGTLGQIRLATMQRTNLGPIRSDVNSGWDLASHDVSISNMLFGSNPESVSAVGASWLQPGIQDAIFASLRYPNDVLVNIQASWMHPKKTRQVVIVGSERMATFDDMDLNEPVRVYDKTVNYEARYGDLADTFGAFRASVVEGDVRIPRVRLGEPLNSECQEFLARIEGRSTSRLSDGWDGYRVVQVLEAMDRSMASGGSQMELPQ